VLPALRPHPNQKTMILFPFSFVGLECSFHCFLFLLFNVRESMLINLLLSVKLEKTAIPFLPEILIVPDLDFSLCFHAMNQGSFNAALG
jgi:hypothetical protein